MEAAIGFVMLLAIVVIVSMLPMLAVVMLFEVVRVLRHKPTYTSGGSPTIWLGRIRKTSRILDHGLARSSTNSYAKNPAASAIQTE